MSSDSKADARASMIGLIGSFHVSRALCVAAELGIADLLREGPRPVAALAAATSTDAASLFRILRLLASAGVFAIDEREEVALTPVSATLCSDAKGSLRAWAIALMGGDAYRAWGALLHSVRTGGTAFDHVFGENVWAYRVTHPESARIFNEGMSSFADAVNDAVLASYPFAAFSRAVDVGGGEGALMTKMLAAHPAMHGVVYDLPHVAAKAQQRIAGAGLATRCQIVAGDFFQEIPSGADAYLLARIIHDWDDERACVILRNCRRAMPTSARLLLIERVVPQRIEASVQTQALVAVDVHMMVMTGGGERTHAEYRALLDATGFELTRIVPTGSVISVIEGAPK